VHLENLERIYILRALIEGALGGVTVNYKYANLQIINLFLSSLTKIDNQLKNAQVLIGNRLALNSFQ
jgi:hypothetical protein